MELKRIEENIRSVFADSSYPQEFLDAYDQMECLASHSGQETFLLRKKDTGEMAVAKCCDRRAFPFRPNPELLADIGHPGLPRLIGQYQNERMLCIVREYIEGEPLSDYARERHLSLPQIADLGGRLCDILTVLHSHEPPIIHRDIKPENVIVRPDGSVALIDFDISRFFKEEAGSDTVFYGTRGYAPPEQYGFGQTDIRADLYAFGVLLRWLVTGSIRSNPNVRIDSRLQRVIDRCTAFAPEDRYENAAQVKAALRESGSGKKPVPVKKILFLSAALLCGLCLGFAAGRWTEWLKPVPALSFSEPLIERAVRLQLGRERGALTADDLTQVTKIFIYGSEAYADLDTYSQQRVDEHQEGPIRTLDDLKLLPNLREIHITRQGYVDISGIADLTHVERVELKHMRVSGAQPVGHISRLKYVCLFDCGLSDVTALENCPWLEELDIGYNDIQSLRQVGTHPNIRHLDLSWLKISEMNDIAERLPRLQTVALKHGVFKDLSGLTKLPSLEAVYVLSDQEEALRDLFSGTDVDIRVTEN